MHSGRKPFIPFLRTKSQLGQKNNQSSEKSYKNRIQDYYDFCKLLLRATINRLEAISYSLKAKYIFKRPHLNVDERCL